MRELSSNFPRFRAVAEHAVLVEFADVIGAEASDRVRQLDALIAAHPVSGFLEAVPAYVSVLIAFDPLVTDHKTVEHEVRGLLNSPAEVQLGGSVREVLVCYDADLAPDLEAVAQACGLSVDEVITAHLNGDYSVFMYGFAPGYAYLAGVPNVLQLPRKAGAIRDVPAGSVLIAGQQCLVSTLVMPTGWWIIGRSPTCILSNDPQRPFLFDVADKVVFRRIGRTEFDAAEKCL